MQSLRHRIRRLMNRRIQLPLVRRDQGGKAAGKVAVEEKEEAGGKARKDAVSPLQWLQASYPYSHYYCYYYSQHSRGRGRRGMPLVVVGGGRKAKATPAADHPSATTKRSTTLRNLATPLSILPPPLGGGTARRASTSANASHSSHQRLSTHIQPRPLAP
ncbi:hypothetical protein B0H34DRAFT_728616 [Crassisporium funariophilum]|nr:hypothetical protein B0H34DRAFT_728616 [Crassisporium funariophilum]